MYVYFQKIEFACMHIYARRARTYACMYACVCAHACMPVCMDARTRMYACVYACGTAVQCMNMFAIKCGFMNACLLARAHMSDSKQNAKCVLWGIYLLGRVRI